MSAWVVDRAHIDVLIAYGLSTPADKVRWRQADGEDGALRFGELTYANATEIGRLLWQENVASVCFRYESDTADEYAEVFDYVYRDPGHLLAHGEALRACHCLGYQSCEHDGWETSEAKAIIDALESKAAHSLACGPWGWTDEELAKRPKVISLFGLSQGLDQAGR